MCSVFFIMCWRTECRYLLGAEAGIVRKTRGMGTTVLFRLSGGGSGVDKRCKTAPRNRSEGDQGTHTTFTNTHRQIRRVFFLFCMCRCRLDLARFHRLVSNEDAFLFDSPIDRYCCMTSGFCFVCLSSSFDISIFA